MAVKLPVAYFEGNLVVNFQRQAWAGYRIQPWHYDHLRSEERVSLLRRLTRLFTDYQDTDGHLQIIPRPHEVAAHQGALRAKLQGPLASAGAAYCDKVTDYLTETHGAEGTDYEFFLWLRLEPPADPWLRFRDWAKGLVSEPARAMADLFGVGVPQLLEHEWRGFIEAERRLYQRLYGLFPGLMPLADNDVEWLIRRGFWRGIGEPPARQGWKPGSTLRRNKKGRMTVTPEYREILTLAEGEIATYARRLTVTQDVDGREVSAHQAFLTLAQLPDELTFPGCEWIYNLQELPFPIEVNLRWRSEDFQATLAALRKRKLDIADQERHTVTSGEDVPLDLQDARALVLALEDEIKANKSPTALVSVTLALAHPDLDTLREQIRELKDHCAPDIQLEVPAGDQLPAFIEAIPGSTRQIKDYMLRLLPHAAAAGMWGAIRRLGDMVGAYIGTTGLLQLPVYFDPARAPQINRSASIVCLGTLGGGKSFLANLIVYLTVLLGNARALVLDPKGERSAWLETLPELRGHVEVITLSSRDEDTGKLDPFAIFWGLGPAYRREAGNLAVSLLAFLSRVEVGSRPFLHILRAVTAVADSDRPCMMAVVEEIERAGQEDEEARDLGEFLRHMAGRAYANLLFGTDPSRGINVTRRLNVLQLQHLKMPPPEKKIEQYDLEELLSSTLMHAVVAFSTAFTQQDRGLFKMVLVDEAWAVLATEQGRTHIETLIRTGRALNNGCLLVTQNSRDLLHEGIRGHLAVKFCFRTTDPADIAKVAELYGLDADEELTHTLRELRNGEALMQDLDGKIGVVSVDAVFQHLKDAFDTRPKAARKAVGGQ